MRGEALGGTFEVLAEGLPVGLGSYTHWDRRLSSRLAEAVASIHAIRGLELGAGFAAAQPSARTANRAGGVEGGMSNGLPLVVRAAMKPLSTLRSMQTAPDVTAEQPENVCGVPAASVVAEAMVCLVLADALLEKFGGDSLEQLHAHMDATGHHVGARP